MLWREELPLLARLKRGELVREGSEGERVPRREGERCVVSGLEAGREREPSSNSETSRCSCRVYRRVSLAGENFQKFGFFCGDSRKFYP